MSTELTLTRATATRDHCPHLPCRPVGGWTAFHSLVLSIAECTQGPPCTIQSTRVANAGGGAGPAHVGVEPPRTRHLSAAAGNVL